MKLVSILRYLLSCIILSGALVSAQPGDDAAGEAARRKYALGVSELTSRIESFIAQELVQKKGYDEEVATRQYTTFDLDHDGKIDVILVTGFGYPIGGNYTESSLLVALSSKPGRVLYTKVGGRGYRYAKRTFVVNSGLHLFIDFSVWGWADAECCPSLESTEELRFDGENLRFVPYDQIKRKG